MAARPARAYNRPMRRLGFSRPVGLLLLAGGLLLALALLFLAARLLPAWAALGRAPTPAPVRLAGLPAPVVTRPAWTSYTYAGPIRDLAQGGGLLWAATDGGLVVWDGAGAAARFNVEHGLPANRVTSVAIGPDGAVWAGTVAGLGRYDGRAWQTFTTADGLPAEAIRDLAVDRAGIVWAATAAGLARYDGQWRVYSAGGLLSALPSDDVAALAVDRANRLWVATAGGLARLEGGRWTTVGDAGRPVEPIRALSAGPDDAMWGLTDFGLLRIEGEIIEHFAPEAAAAGELPATFRALAVGPDGQVYTTNSADDGGLSRLDPPSDAWQRIALAPRPAAGEALGALLIDERGALWVGVGDAARRYDGAWQALAGPSDLPAANLADLAYAQGAVWVASPGGVARFDGRWQRFGVAEGLAAADARALAVAADGALWVAYDTPLRGLSRYGPDGWQTLTCPTAAPTSATVLDAAQTPGAVWFATAGGVSRFDGVAWRTFDARDGLPDAPATALAARGQTVWAATARGIARYDGAVAGGRWQLVSDAPARALAVAPDGALWVYDGVAVGRLDEAARAPLPLPTAVRGMAATDGALWLATPDGVLRYDGGWTVFTPDDGLPSIDVTAIAAAGGRVWAATSGGPAGIDVVVYDGRRWQPHPNRDEAAELLSDDALSSVLATADGDLWLGTAGGVARYHNGRWTSHTVADGLPADRVNALAWALGTVWAGTEKGLARFNGSGWEAFGGASPNEAGPPVTALAVAPSGELWVSLGRGQPNGLRVFDGRAWRVVDRPSPAAFVTHMAFLEAGRLLAIVEEEGGAALGVYDGQTWTLRPAQALQLEPRALALSPDGRRLWLTGLLPEAAGRAPDAVTALGPATPPAAGTAVVALAVTADDLGAEIGRFAAPDIAAYDGDALAAAQPIAFGPQGRVYVGGAGRVYVFDGDAATLAAPATLELPLPFTRTTTGIAIAPDGRLWVGTENGLAGWDGTAWQTFYAAARAPEWWGSATALLPRADGGILLGTSGGAIGLYTGRAFEGTRRPAEGPAEWAGAFPTVRALLFDDAGRLWAASERGVARLADAWEVVAPDATLAGATTALAAAGEQLWLGTTTGWAAVAPVGDSCRFATVAPTSAVSDALADRQGAVWLATAAEGVWRIVGADAPLAEVESQATAMALAPNGDVWFAGDRQPWLLRHRAAGGDDAWSRLPLDLALIAPRSLAALAVAPDLDLWLGGDGLVRFHGGQWSKLTTADGLADNGVNKLLVTPDGAVWAATPGGLSRYRP